MKRIPESDLASKKAPERSLAAKADEAIRNKLAKFLGKNIQLEIENPELLGEILSSEGALIITLPHSSHADTYVIRLAILKYIERLCEQTTDDESLSKTEIENLYRKLNALTFLAADDYWSKFPFSLLAKLFVRTMLLSRTKKGKKPNPGKVAKQCRDFARNIKNGGMGVIYPQGGRKEIDLDIDNVTLRTGGISQIIEYLRDDNLVVILELVNSGHILPKGQFKPNFSPEEKVIVRVRQVIRVGEFQEEIKQGEKEFPEDRQSRSNAIIAHIKNAFGGKG